MKLSAKYWGSGFMVVGVIVALLGSTMAFARNSNPGVLPPNSHPYGLTYGEWSARWWQWAFKVTTFDDCTVNQSGQVWFLAGTAGGSATRPCAIPSGKAILFPIFNAEQSDVEARSQNTGNLPGSTCGLRDINGNLITGTDYPALRACATAFAQHALDPDATLLAKVDGVTLQSPANYRAVSPLFSFTAVPNNPFASTVCADGCPVTGNAAADGFWIMLTPLSTGPHTIYFKADIPSFPFTTEVTYNLTVG